MRGNAGNPPIHKYHSLINSSEHLLCAVQALYERLKMQEYETNLAPTSERLHFTRKQTSKLQHNLISAMKREEQGNMGGNRRTQTECGEGRKIFPEATGATSVVCL